MNRHADKMYEKALRGGTFTPAEIRHIGECADCRAAIAHARSFDEALGEAARSLAQAPLPLELVSQRRSLYSSRTWALSVGAALVAAVVVAWGISSGLPYIRTSASSPVVDSSASIPNQPTIAPSTSDNHSPGPIESLHLISDANLKGGSLTALAADEVMIAAGGALCSSYDSCSPAIWTSSDGRRWSSPSPLPEGGDDTPVAIATGPRGWVVIGESHAWFSSDGMKWTLAAGDFVHGLADGGPSYPAEGGCCGVALRAVTAVESGFVAVGGVTCYACNGRAAAWVSTDGTSWKRVAYSQVFADAAGAMNSVIELATGQVIASGVMTSWISDDGGQTWHGHESFNGQLAPTLLAIDEKRQVVALTGSTSADAGGAWSSVDGVSWKYSPVPTLSASEITAVGNVRGTILIAVDRQTGITDHEQQLMKFDDTLGSEPAIVESSSNARINGISEIPGGVVAVGVLLTTANGAAPGAVWTSP